MIDRSGYKIAHTLSSFYHLIDSGTVVSLDLETTSRISSEAEVVGLGLAFSEDECYYIDFRHFNKTLKHTMKALLDKNIRIVGQNLKYDYVVLDKDGMMPGEAAFDTLLAEYLLDPNVRRGRSLDDLSRKYLNHTCISFKDLVSTTANKAFSEVPLEAAAEYCCEDVDVALRLAKILGPKLKEAGLSRVFYDIEMPTMLVLAKMEARGVKIDKDYLSTLEQDFAARKLMAQEDIYDMAGGGEFNLNSSKQLQKVLYDKLGIEKGKETKTGWSTSASTLADRKEEHPIINRLLEWRQMDKLLSTFVRPLPNRINKRTGRVHTQFNQAIAATGRLTSSSPNLQNIPARGDAGKQLRNAFTCELDNVLVVADYSQIELRVFAHYSNDPFLIESYKKGLDIHEETAKKIFRTHSPTKDERSRAKTLNFGILYGMSPHRLAREQKMPVAEAEAFFEAYFEALPGVVEFMERAIATSRKRGYAQTLFGRKRPLPDLYSNNFGKQRGAERMAVSTIIQGTAADIMKLALISIDKSLPPLSWLILSVHDEVVVECAQNIVDNVKMIVENSMVNAAQLNVPLVVNVGVGRTWGEAK